MDNEAACKYRWCCSIESQFGLFVVVIIMIKNGNNASPGAALQVVHWAARAHSTTNRAGCIISEGL